MSTESVTGPAEAIDAEGRMLLRISEFRKRRPRLPDKLVTMAHGAGGKSSAALIDHVFVEAFRNPTLEGMGDSASLQLPSGERLAFSTDSFVVQPLFFPGGSIGHLAVHGTVNDLAVSGARPRWLSAAFVLEEGLPIEDLHRVVADMRDAALGAGVDIVTGDTKVVPRGAVDGMHISTAGIGVIPAGRSLGAERVQAGDRVVLSGALGAHGMAVMLARGGLDLEADITSDTMALHDQVTALLEAAPSTRWMRDATRGGLATVCNELVGQSGLGLVLDEGLLPVAPAVAGACDMLGIDPIYVANEGVFVAIVAADEAEAAVVALRECPGGAQAAVVGEIVANPAGIVAMRTPFGGTRIVDMLVGDPLPRIC
jgi:hydrogenase expression/formation protein HypE